MGNVPVQASAIELGAYDDARVSLKRLLERAPDFPQHDVHLKLAHAEMQLAMWAMNKGEFDAGARAARRYLELLGPAEQAVRHLPQPRQRTLLYDIYRFLDDDDGVVAVVGAVPGDTWGPRLGEIVGSLISAERLEAALDLARRVPSDQATKFDHVGMLIYDLMKRGRFDDAESVLRRGNATGDGALPDWYMRCVELVDGGVLPENAVTMPVADPASYVRPVFPELARVARLEGRVILQAMIRADGSVDDVQTLHCNRPNLGFEQAAIAAVSQWSYTPAMVCGEAIDLYLSVRIDFDLH